MALNMTLQLRVCHYDFLIQAKDLGETNTLLKNIYVGETFSPTYRSQICQTPVRKPTSLSHSTPFAKPVILPVVSSVSGCPILIV